MEIENWKIKDLKVTFKLMYGYSGKKELKIGKAYSVSRLLQLTIAQYSYYFILYHYLPQPFLVLNVCQIKLILRYMEKIFF